MVASSDDELRAWVVGAVLHGRASTTREILARLERAGVRVDEGDAEAALVTSPATDVHVHRRPGHDEDV